MSADAVAHMGGAGRTIRLNGDRYDRPEEIKVGRCVGTITFTDHGWITVKCKHPHHATAARSYDAAIADFAELVRSR